MESNVKADVTLKSLKSRLEKEKAESSVISKQMNELKEQQKVHSKRVESLLRQIKDLTKEDLVMSEHAILQFLRRVELIPIEEVEKRVITEEFKRIWKVVGDAQIPIGIGEHMAIVKSGVITTII
jgi:predicted transcriptional regulator